MSIVHDSCDDANVDEPCLSVAIAKLKVDNLWEDVARAGIECAGEAGEICRVLRLLEEAEGRERTLGKCSTRMVQKLCLITHPIARLFFTIPVR